MKKICISLIASLILASCGGGSGGGGNSQTTAVNASPNGNLGGSTNIAELGLLSGSDIKITTTEGDLLYQTATNTKGEFYLDKDLLNSNKNKLGYKVNFLIVSAEGGVDTDPDDDGLIVEAEFKQVYGTVRGIIAYKDVIDNPSFKVNLISSAIYDLIKENDLDITEETIRQVANDIGVEDINDDGVVDNKDVFQYSMVANESEAENILRIRYLSSIHAGDDAVRVKYVEDIGNQFSPVKFKKRVSGSTMYISLTSFRKQNHILFTLNKPKDETLISDHSNSVYGGNEIALNEGDILYVQECSSKGKCFREQVLYFDGGESHNYVAVDTSIDIYRDSEKLEQLKTSLKQEIDSMAQLNSEEYYESEKKALVITKKKLVSDRDKKQKQYDELINPN